MGLGEDTYVAFWDWFKGLSDARAEEYVKKYPEPRGWHGKYDQIRNSRK
jgi:hypothetical protein